MTSQNDRPRVKVKSIAKFPADVVAGDGLTITQSGATYTFNAPGIAVAQGAAEDAEAAATAAAASAAAAEAAAEAAEAAAQAAPAHVDLATTGAIPDTVIFINTTQSGPITLTVPLSATWAANTSQYGARLEIYDASGTAGSNNVTLAFSGGETANGLSSLTIDVNYGGVRLAPMTGGGWIVAV